MLQDQAVQRARAVLVEARAEPRVELPHPGGGVHRHAAVGVAAVDGGVRRRRLNGEGADDLLQDVLQRHQPLDVAVLVDHQPQAALLPLELGQLLVEAGAGGNEAGLAHRLADARRRQLLAEELRQDLAQVQEADHVVQAALEHRQAGERRPAQLVQHLAPVVAQVDADDLAALHHDVLDPDLLQVEDAEQHAPVPLRQQAAGFAHRAAQLLAGQGVAALLRRHAAQPQQAVGEAVDQPHQRPGQRQQRAVDDRGRQRHPLGVQRAQGLRRHLREHQEGDGQQPGRHRHAQLLEMDVAQVSRQLRDQDVDQVVAEQDQPDQAVRPLQQRAGAARAVVALLGQVPEPVAVERHQRRLRAGEERRQHEQQGQQPAQQPRGVGHALAPAAGGEAGTEGGHRARRPAGPAPAPRGRSKHHSTAL